MGHLLYERRGPVAVLTLNRPDKHNAIDGETAADLRRVFDEVATDPSIRVGVITGAGEVAFSAGGFIPGYLEKLGPDGSGLSDMPVPKLTGHPKPWIAAVNGHCLGGAFGIAISCDLRIASPNATFAVKGVKMGLISGSHQSQTLVRLIPFCHALEMLLLGDTISAEEAYRIGLVNKVVPLPDLLPAALAWAETIAANAPIAVRSSKELAYRGRDLSWEEAVKLETEQFQMCSRSEDALEGFRAFQERRPPVFHGR